MGTKRLTLNQVLEEQLQDPEFRKTFDELELAYQVARLRVLRGWTQAELARRVGTRQPSIARLESGAAAPSLRFLQRVVDVLGGTLSIRIYADPQPDSPQPCESNETQAQNRMIA